MYFIMLITFQMIVLAKTPFLLTLFSFGEDLLLKIEFFLKQYFSTKQIFICVNIILGVFFLKCIYMCIYIYMYCYHKKKFENFLKKEKKYKTLAYRPTRPI
jgi:hypothetical protein